jgi:endonuclease I
MGRNLRLAAAIWTAAALSSFGQVPQTVLFPDLTGNALLEQVRSAYKPTTVWSYNAARDRMFGDIDNQSGTVICVYTGTVIAVEAVITGARTRAFDAGFNTEHVFPQSKGASTGNANSDLHHLMPVRADVNSSRGNSPFGFVASENVTRWWGPSGGLSSQPAPPLTPYSRTQSSSRFEPRDEWKGDIARAVFYFYTMYTDQAMTADPNFFKGMMADLRAFHAQDPVTQAEYDRTYRIAGYQQDLANPFIIDTTLVRRMFFTDFTYPSLEPEEEGGPYTATFDGITSKTSYAEAAVTINGVSWTLAETLIGNLAADRKTGTHALRFRTSSDTRAEMLDNLPDGVGNVSFDAARYDGSGDRSATAPTFVVEVNVDGVWHAVGDPVSMDQVDVLTPYSFSVQEPGPSRIRFRVTGGSGITNAPGTSGGRRFNLDNLVITPFVAEVAEFNVSIGSATGWRLMTSPVATTYAQLLEPVWTQGATGSDAPNAASNVMRFADGGFLAVTDLNTALSAGEAFLYAHVNDDDYDGTPNAAPSVLSVSGAIPAGKRTVQAGGAGYLLVGNPFATAVDFGSAVRSGGALDKVWVYDPAEMRYRSMAAGFGDFDGRIHPFQAFWLEADAGGTFGFDRGAFTETAIFFGKETRRNHVRIRAEAGGRTDDAFVALHPDADAGLDALDAAKFPPLDSPSLMLSTRVGESRLGIQFLQADLNHALRIPVEIVSMLVGPVTVGLADADLPEGWSAWLEHDAGGYALVIDPGTSTSTPDAGRETPDAIALYGAYPNPFNPSTQIRFTLDAGRQTTLKVYDILGREVAVLVNGTLPAGSHTAAFDASTLTSGVYIVRLTAGGESLTRRISLVK